MSRPGPSRLLPLVAGLLTSFLAVAINLWTDLVPAAWTSWPPYPWVVGTGVVLLALGIPWLSVHHQSRDPDADARSSRPVRRPADGIAIENNNAPFIHAPGGVVHLYSAATSPAPPPALDAVDNLPLPSGHFTGRERFLRLVHTRLAQANVKVIAIHGMGGVGKTQLALEFARRWVADRQPSITWWIRAEEPTTAVEDLVALASALGLPQHTDHAQSLARLHAELRRRSDWILVFDNAAAPERVQEWLPGGSGTVVVTSRHRGWGHIAGQIKLSSFTRTESLSYLRRRVERYDRKHAEELAEQLGHLPLALAQAAGYMDARDLGIDDYLRKLGNTNLSGSLLEEHVVGYGSALAKTWLLQYDHLVDRCPAGLDLLHLCSFFAPDEIDLDDLLSDSDKLPPALAAACRDPVQLDEVVDTLVRGSVIDRVRNHRVRVHRILADVTRHQLVAGKQKPVRWRPGLPSQLKVAMWARVAVELVEARFLNPWSPAAWTRCAELAGHAAATANHAATFGAAGHPAAALLTRLGQYLHTQARYEEACHALNRAVDMFEQVEGPDHPDVAWSLTTLGIVQQARQDLPAACASLTRALDILERNHGPMHDDVARTLNALGMVQRTMGSLVSARANLSRSVQIFEHAYGTQHSDVGWAMAHLGETERRLGNLPAAHTKLVQALAISEAVHGPDAPNVAWTLVALARTNLESGDTPAAQVQLLRALSIYEGANGHGPQHPQVGWVLAVLALVQRRLGDVAAARVSRSRAESICQAISGPMHADTVEALLSSSDVAD